MNIDITEIVVTLIGILGTIITTVLLPKVITYIKTNTNQKQQAIISAIAKASVYAAQQLFTDATQKKEYAIKYVDNMLLQYGIELNAESISDAIESALKQIKTETGNSWNSETTSQNIISTNSVVAE